MTHASPILLVRQHFAGLAQSLTPMVHMTKGRDGWEAETKIEIFPKHILSVNTRKGYNGGIYTAASVGIRDGGFMTHRLYQDYNKRVDVRPKARCTEKAVSDLHAESLKRLAEIVTDALEHYHAKGELPELAEVIEGTVVSGA